MTFDPKVIEHLGVRMYSTLPPVLGELIANAYDADATKVDVKLKDTGEKEIVVEDNGIGMSFADLNDKFLVIGRDRRKDGEGLTPKGRKVIGKKGLGKLSFFGIVQTITINTVNQGKRNIFTMDWKDLMNSTGSQYLMTPKVIDETVEGDDVGTKVVLTNINRVSDFSEELIANSIARIFIFDKDFSVTICCNDKEAVVLSNDMHFSSFGEEFSWAFPNDFAHLKSDYEYRSDIRGKIITPEKPIAPKFDSRGISLFSRGKLVQRPYQFSNSTSSHFFSYMTGWLEVDFIEDFHEDVISTNRQNINWGYWQARELHEYFEECIHFIQADWRKKREGKKIIGIDRNLQSTDSKAWKESIPENIRGSFDVIFDALVKDLPEVGSDKSNEIFSNFIKIIPPYPYYHWRNLHPLIKNELYPYYRREEYLEAAKEGVIIYEEQVKDKLGLEFSGVELMNHAFSFKGKNEKGTIKIDRFPSLLVSDLSSDTGLNIQRGQRSLSAGLLEAFRNPASHRPRVVLNELFSHDDCLNILSLVSFLLYRVDNVKRNG